MAERIELRHGAWLLWEEHFLGAEEETLVLSALLREVALKQETIRLFGKTILQPRLSAWHGDPEATYTYSGLTLAPVPFTPTLHALRERIDALTGHSFNSVLVNYYRSGEDSMGMHADDEPELGDNPLIASLSLGAKRTFVMKPQKKGDPAASFELGEGSLLVMGGTSQHHYRHGIAKQPGRGARMNLTFRRILARTP